MSQLPHQPLRALATDYDGTLAHHGVVSEDTLAALQRFKAAGYRLILVTGRELNDFLQTFHHMSYFDLAVLENGAVLMDPATNSVEALAAPPPLDFITRLTQLGVPLQIGQVIVATWEPHEHHVLQAIKDLGLELQVIFNKGAVMILPSGVNKATGLQAALTKLGLSPGEVVGIGDAENDHAFLEVCGYSVAVANALPAIQERAHYVTTRSHGDGVVEFIDVLLQTPHSIP